MSAGGRGASRGSYLGSAWPALATCWQRTGRTAVVRDFLFSCGCVGRTCITCDVRDEYGISAYTARTACGPTCNVRHACGVSTVRTQYVHVEYVVSTLSAPSRLLYKP